MDTTRNLQRILEWLRRQELLNAHVISVLEGRHTPQFAALKRVLDGRSLEGLESSKHSFRVHTDSPESPACLAVTWDSEACEHWHSPPRRIIEVVTSNRPVLSCLEEAIVDALSDEFETCIVTNDKRTRDWIKENCRPTAWHLNVIYTAQESRYRPRITSPVRMLTLRDDKAVTDFVERAGSDEHGSTSGQYELAKRGLFFRCYGSFNKDRLTGFLTVFDRTTNVTEVLWVRVDESYRGQGIGSALLSKATNDILAAGKIPMYLTTSSNIPAISMISRLGFTFAYERYTAQITEV